ncbi:hypothetical protein CKA32_002098 [Geitlerinema sp. FC II]|nr:hypothetical protein [Geitlerinema sp. CS-897]PPT11255.1 hypothetical protein CKA32_002098 [Geitlerinema sp. FC II]
MEHRIFTQTLVVKAQLSLNLRHTRTVFSPLHPVTPGRSAIARQLIAAFQTAIALTHPDLVEFTTIRKESKTRAGIAG